MDVLEKLKKAEARIKRSPGRRDVPYSVYQECVREFGSFNAAKEKAGLELKRRSPCKQLTPSQKQHSETLAKIVSYITFDGHLYNSLKGFYVASNNVADLLTFEEWVIEQFGIKAKKIDKTNNSHRNYRIWFFNVNVAKFLHDSGTPKGDKPLVSYRVPWWIRQDMEYARAYLQIAYLCEGSNKENRKNPRIRINQYKDERILSSGALFMDDLKVMLSLFGISTGVTIIGAGTHRVDGIVTKELKFNVSAKDNERFYQEIGWLK